MNNSKQSFVFLVILAATSSMLRAHAYRVVGYYPMRNRATLPAQAARYDVRTHINHAFAWPNPDGSISSSEMCVDTPLILIDAQTVREGK